MAFCFATFFLAICTNTDCPVTGRILAVSAKVMPQRRHCTKGSVCASFAFFVGLMAVLGTCGCLVIKGAQRMAIGIYSLIVAMTAGTSFITLTIFGAGSFFDGDPAAILMGLRNDLMITVSTVAGNSMGIVGNIAVDQQMTQRSHFGLALLCLCPTTLTDDIVSVAAFGTSGLLVRCNHPIMLVNHTIGQIGLTVAAVGTSTDAVAAFGAASLRYLHPIAEYMFCCCRFHMVAARCATFPVMAGEGILVHVRRIIAAFVSRPGTCLHAVDTGITVYRQLDAGGFADHILLGGTLYGVLMTQRRGDILFTVGAVCAIPIGTTLGFAGGCNFDPVTHAMTGSSADPLVVVITAQITLVAVHQILGTAGSKNALGVDVGVRCNIQGYIFIDAALGYANR